VNAELGGLTHWQQNGMFFVNGADAINNGIALQQVLLAEQGVLCAESVPTISPTKLLPLFSSTPHSAESIWSKVSLWLGLGSLA
jgi:hypothetical protein